MACFTCVTFHDDLGPFMVSDKLLVSQLLVTNNKKSPEKTCLGIIPRLTLLPASGYFRCPWNKLEETEPRQARVA